MKALIPGAIIKIHNQGVNITPHSVDVAIVWVNDTDVWYCVEGTFEVKQTSIERFKEIMAQA
jgi:hypothetical protein